MEKKNKNKTQTEKDGELEKEERSKGERGQQKQKNNGKEKQKSVVNRFPKVRCSIDAILGHWVRAQGCISVELTVPERKHEMAECESLDGRRGGERRG